MMGGRAMKKTCKMCSFLLTFILTLNLNVYAEMLAMDESDYIHTNVILDRDDFQSDDEYEEYLSLKPTEEIISPMTMADLTPTKNPIASNINYNFDFSNADSNNAIQNFCFDSTGSIIYVTQNASEKDGYNGTANKGDVILSRCRLNGSTIQFLDSMILKNVGHGQTLEMYTYSSKTYFLISCDENQVGTTYWSTQIGRVQYKSNTTITSSNINRLNYLSYANKNMVSDDAVKRCDAAISADSNLLLIWCKLDNDHIQYSCYDFNVINKQLNTATKVSFKNNTTLNKAIKYSILQKGSSKIFPQSSFQGIEVTNNGNMYISSGKITDKPWLCNVSKKGVWNSTIQVKFPNVTNTFEMEGIKIRGSYLYFAGHFGSRNNRIGRVLKSELD